MGVLLCKNTTRRDMEFEKNSKKNIQIVGIIMLGFSLSNGYAIRYKLM